MVVVVLVIAIVSWTAWLKWAVQLVVYKLQVRTLEIEETEFVMRPSDVVLLVESAVLVILVFVAWVVDVVVVTVVLATRLLPRSYPVVIGTWVELAISTDNQTR